MSFYRKDSSSLFQIRPIFIDFGRMNDWLDESGLSVIRNTKSELSLIKLIDFSIPLIISIQVISAFSFAMTFYHTFLC